MYLVDTNVVSEARRQSPQAVAWLRSIDPAAVYLSVITIGEIMRGIAMKQNKDGRAAVHLAEWLQKLRRDHAGKIISISDEVALEWGRLSARRPRGDADGLVAATAVIHNLILVTRNVADFDDTAILIINPWDASRPSS